MCFLIALQLAQSIWNRLGFSMMNFILFQWLQCLVDALPPPFMWSTWSARISENPQNLQERPRRAYIFSRILLSAVRPILSLYALLASLEVVLWQS